MISVTQAMFDDARRKFRARFPDREPTIDELASIIRQEQEQEHANRDRNPEFLESLSKEMPKRGYRSFVVQESNPSVAKPVEPTS